MTSADFAAGFRATVESSVIFRLSEESVSPASVPSVATGSADIEHTEQSVSTDTSSNGNSLFLTHFLKLLFRCIKQVLPVFVIVYEATEEFMNIHSCGCVKQL